MCAQCRGASSHIRTSSPSVRTLGTGRGFTLSCLPRTTNPSTQGVCAPRQGNCTSPVQRQSPVPCLFSLLSEPNQQSNWRVETKGTSHLVSLPSPAPTATFLFLGKKKKGAVQPGGSTASIQGVRRRHTVWLHIICSYSLRYHH